MRYQNSFGVFMQRWESLGESFDREFKSLQLSEDDWGKRDRGIEQGEFCGTLVVRVGVFRIYEMLLVGGELLRSFHDLGILTSDQAAYFDGLLGERRERLRAFCDPQVGHGVRVTVPGFGGEPDYRG